MRKRATSFLLLLFALAVPAAAQLSEEATARLAALGRVWGAVKFAHPILGYREVDWDLAAVRAIPAARDAQSPERFAAVVDEMLATLGDPLTRVAPQCIEQAPAATPAPPPPFTAAAEATIVIPLATLAADTLDSAVVDALKSARSVIVDLRTPAGRCATPALPQWERIAPMLFDGLMTGPVQRRVYHRGYRSQQTATVFFGYTSSWSKTTTPLFSGSNASVAKTFFVVDERSTLPPAAQAIAHRGRGTLIAVGPFRESSMVSTMALPIGGGYEAIVRTSEIVGDNGPVPAAPLVMLPADASEAMIVAAAAHAAPPRRRPAALQSARNDYVWRADDPYTAMRAPAFEYRILAAYRLWNVIEYFYGYKELIGEWAPRLPRMIAIMDGAAAQRDYELGIAAMMMFVPDGHSYPGTNAVTELRGRAAAPFTTMPVEGRPVVMYLTGDSAVTAGVRPGDELTAVDGRAAGERIAELRPILPASTELEQTYYAMLLLPRGPEGSTATFSFRRPDGTTYEATLSRSTSYVVKPPVGKPWKILPGDVGYVDLNWLEVADVDAMIEAMDGTRGLILDNRGYPLGVFPWLGRRLNVKGNGEVAQIRVPNVIGGIVEKPLEIQNIGTSSLPPYRGKTVMLVDERAQSQSEHTALVCEALAGTIFVGSPTAGANGNITQMVLPGGNFVTFGGMDVRHLDGRQLQRVGIVPDVLVPRTIDAVAKRRDEVLEKAVEIVIGN